MQFQFYLFAFCTLRTYFRPYFIEICLIVVTVQHAARRAADLFVYTLRTEATFAGRSHWCILCSYWRSGWLLSAFLEHVRNLSFSETKF